jgi:hypothetical protein
MTFDYGDSAITITEPFDHVCIALFSGYGGQREATRLCPVFLCLRMIPSAICRLFFFEQVFGTEKTIE